jgi:hypothetical protein
VVCRYPLSRVCARFSHRAVCSVRLPPRARRHAILSTAVALAPVPFLSSTLCSYLLIRVVHPLSVYLLRWSNGTVHGSTGQSSTRFYKKTTMGMWSLHGDRWNRAPKVKNVSLFDVFLSNSRMNCETVWHTYDFVASYSDCKHMCRWKRSTFACSGSTHSKWFLPHPPPNWPDPQPPPQNRSRTDYQFFTPFSLPGFADNRPPLDAGRRIQ